MKPTLTVEFHAQGGEYAFEEESVTIGTPEELFAFIAPGGGCDAIPDEVEEIRVIFLPPSHPNTQNPVADAAAMLQLHSVLITGPLAEIAQTAQAIIDRAGRGELAPSFLRAIGVND